MILIIVLIILITLVCLNSFAAEKIPNGLFSNWGEYLTKKNEEFVNMQGDVKEMGKDLEKIRVMVNKMFIDKYSMQEFYELMLEVENE